MSGVGIRRGSIAVELSEMAKLVKVSYVWEKFGRGSWFECIDVFIRVDRI